MELNMIKVLDAQFLKGLKNRFPDLDEKVISSVYFAEKKKLEDKDKPDPTIPSRAEQAALVKLEQFKRKHYEKF